MFVFGPECFFLMMFFSRYSIWIRVEKKHLIRVKLISRIREVYLGAAVSVISFYWPILGFAPLWMWGNRSRFNADDTVAKLQPLKIRQFSSTASQPHWFGLCGAFALCSRHPGRPHQLRRLHSWKPLSIYLPFPLLAATLVSAHCSSSPLVHPLLSVSITSDWTSGCGSTQLLSGYRNQSCMEFKPKIFQILCKRWL